MVRHQAYAQGLGDIAVKPALSRHVACHRELRRDFRCGMSVPCHYPFPIHAFVMMFHRGLHRLYLNGVLRLLIKYNCVTK